MKLLNLVFNYLLMTCSKKNCTNFCSAKKMSNYKIRGFSINNLGSFVLQGICFAKDVILITAYDANDKLKSKVYVIDNNVVIHEARLYNKCHAGGICYDKKHDNVWITDSSGTISCYKFNDIMTQDDVEPIHKRINVGDDLVNVYGNNAVAFITFFNNRLYLGNFNEKRYSIIKHFSVKKDGNINLSSEKRISGDGLIQGIHFIKLGKVTYLLTSSSYSFMKSILKIYEYDNKLKRLDDRKSMNCHMPPMMEQIICDNSTLIAVFESNAKKYKKYHINNDDVMLYNIDKILNDEKNFKKE